LAVAGCNSSKGRIDKPLAFDANEAAFVLKQGTATIRGHAFVINNLGRAQNVVGQNVFLVPQTAYSRQRVEAIFESGKSIQSREAPDIPSDPDYLKYTRRWKTDSDGRFLFDNVAPGAYFVVTQMSWKKDDPPDPDADPETALRKAVRKAFQKDSDLLIGAAMYETVTVTGKEKAPIDVVVSGGIGG
jgi:hypothetical protein